MKVRILQETAGKHPVLSEDAQGNPVVTNVQFRFQVGEVVDVPDKLGAKFIEHTPDPIAEAVEG